MATEERKPTGNKVQEVGKLPISESLPMILKLLKGGKTEVGISFLESVIAAQ